MLYVSCSYKANVRVKTGNRYSSVSQTVCRGRFAGVPRFNIYRSFHPKLSKCCHKVMVDLNAECRLQCLKTKIYCAKDCNGCTRARASRRRTRRNFSPDLKNNNIHHLNILFVLLTPVCCRISSS